MTAQAQAQAQGKAQVNAQGKAQLPAKAEAKAKAKAKDELGRRGEALAVDFLRQLGCSVLAQNWRCSLGEIDVIVCDGTETVFVEVKTRSSVAFGHPLEAITGEKLARLRRLAAVWCEAHPAPNREIRIDAIAVIASPGEAPQLDHLRRIF